MRVYLLSAPWWVLSLVHGLLFGGFMAAFWGLYEEDGTWARALLVGLVGGVLFGAVMGPVGHRQNQAAREAAGPLSPSDRRAALRASTRGPAPRDPSIRHAAHRLAVQRLAEMRRQRTFSVLTFTAVVFLSIVLALTSSPWWWLGTVYFLAFLVGQLWLPRHLQRRLQLLRGD